MQDRPRVGEILVAAGIIDTMQLDAALGEQQRWGRRLGVTLIKLGMVEEGHLIRALAKQLDLPVASLVGKRIPDDVIALVPARMASEHGVIPLFTKDEGPGGQLYLGMEDPSNLEVLDDLSFRTGMEIHPVMVGPTELGEAIDRYYHGRADGAPKSDPFRRAEAMNPSNLRVVTDDSPQPGTAPVAGHQQTIESEIAAGRSEARTRATIELLDTTSTAAVQSAPKAPALAPEAPAPTPVAAPEPTPVFDPRIDVLEGAVGLAIDETERTRIVAKAIAQLLIEKEILTLDEIQLQIATLKAAADADADGSSA